MAVKDIGIILNGATGRIGATQHLANALAPIRAEGGLQAGPDRIVPRLLLLGRDRDALAGLAQSYGIDDWTTDLDAALAMPDFPVFFDAAATKQNIGYVLFPTETNGPSFTVGGPGTVWMITSQSKNKDLAWEFIKTWNNKDTVAKLNIEDPHPVARTDSADVPEFKANQFLVDSTKSLEKAKFTPVDAAWGKVVSAIQSATERAETSSVTTRSSTTRSSCRTVSCTALASA